MARLVFNGGSSSWKCGAYDVPADARAIDAAPPLAEVRVSWDSSNDHAEIETVATDGSRGTRRAKVAREAPVPFVLDALAGAGIEIERCAAIGHRIVHGAHRFTRTTWLDDSVVSGLRELAPFAPSHNPVELAAVAAVRERYPNVPQYAVFDTQFHRTLAPSAYTYPGPYEWLAQNVRRYGFHGSSVAYASERAAAMLERNLEETQLVVAHLGSGCSVSAVRNGESVDTSMGFTPLEGAMMSTRSGSIDPAIPIYLMREAAKAGPASLEDFANELDDTLNKASGLLGISGVSGDLREVLAARDAGNARAALAVDLFVHRLAATIGAILPSLDRLDALVFTGGIGEHAPAIRAAACARLAYAGVALDVERNAARPADTSLSPSDNRVATLVVTAREDWYIAREGARLAG